MLLAKLLEIRPFHGSLTRNYPSAANCSHHELTDQIDGLGRMHGGRIYG
jgi:hypothetical protein